MADTDNASERVLVCISGNPQSTALVRHTHRFAQRLQAPWAALYVENTTAQCLGKQEKDIIASCQRLAEGLGGEAARIPGRSIAAEIIAYARAHDVTQIIVGRSERWRWSHLLRGSVVHALLRASGGIGIHVIPAGSKAPADQAPPDAVRIRPQVPFAGARVYIAALAAVGLALAVALFVRHFLGVDSIDLVFLIAIIGVAVRFGLWPSVLASLASVLANNFFFLPPLYTFTITDPANIAALFFFFLVALIVSNLAGRARDQAETARLRARTTEALYAFSRKVAGVASLDDLLWATVFQIASMLRLNVVALLPEDGTLSVRAGYPPEDALDGADVGAARWCWENNRPAGRGAETLPGAKRLFLPLRTGRGPVGVVGLDSELPGPLLTADGRRLLDALLDQTAVALERVRLAQEIDAARMLAETQRLREALLTSISHDLTTPLAAILAAATSIQQYDDLLGPTERREMVGTIRDEAERLTRFVRNLLDMTRLESGALAPNADVVDLGEVVGAALERSARTLARHRVELRLARDLPMLPLDAVLLEQVLVNLLDNAAKYAPEGSTITVAAADDDNTVRLEVRDEGEGIPPADLAHIFDKFYRADQRDRQRAGTGLGLAVCRGFVEALGGSIAAGNRSDRSGAVFTIEFPLPLRQPRQIKDATL